MIQRFEQGGFCLNVFGLPRYGCQGCGACNSKEETASIVDRKLERISPEKLQSHIRPKVATLRIRAYIDETYRAVLPTCWPIIIARAFMLRCPGGEDAYFRTTRTLSSSLTNVFTPFYGNSYWDFALVEQVSQEVLDDWARKEKLEHGLQVNAATTYQIGEQLPKPASILYRYRLPPKLGDYGSLESKLASIKNRVIKIPYKLAVGRWGVYESEQRVLDKEDIYHIGMKFDGSQQGLLLQFALAPHLDPYSFLAGILNLPRWKVLRVPLLLVDYFRPGVEGFLCKASCEICGAPVELNLLGRPLASTCIKCSLT